VVILHVKYNKLLGLAHRAVEWATATALLFGQAFTAKASDVFGSTHPKSRRRARVCLMHFQLVMPAVDS
jgi:hypothetical protein